jgi:hypothetical protein
LFSLSPTAYGQNVGAWEIEETNVKPWLVSDFIKYQGVYHFGEGDGSNLILLINDSTITVQIRETGYWTEGGYAVESGIAKLSELEMKWEFKNLTNVTIKGDKFYSDQYQGEFVTYTDSTGQYSGLKINNPWNTWVGKDRYEIGFRLTDFEMARWFPGKYPKTSTQHLKSTDLDTLTKEDLKIMRNEIFARYDYAFEKEGEMDIYFQQQAWYRNRYADVSGFLTNIELANIEIIKRLEDTR